MKLKNLLIGMIATAFLACQTTSCTNTNRKYKVKPSEMVTVKTDESDPPSLGETYYFVTEMGKHIQSSKKPDPRDITEQFYKVMKVEKKDYKTVIKELKTPLEAKLYCTEVLEYENDSVVYGKDDYWASFKYVHKNKKDDCDGGAFAAAAILSDDGFPPYIAVLSKERNPCKVHTIFVYKTTKGKYGSIGINASDCLSGYDSMEELVKCLGYNYFQIYNLSKRFPNYINNDKNNNLLK